MILIFLYQSFLLVEPVLPSINTNANFEAIQEFGVNGSHFPWMRLRMNFRTLGPRMTMKPFGSLVFFS